MRLSVTLDLPTDAHAAARLLADPEYVHQKVRASGALEQHVDVTGSADGAFTVTTRRALPTDQIPAHLRSLVATGSTSARSRRGKRPTRTAPGWARWWSRSPVRPCGSAGARR